MKDTGVDDIEYYLLHNIQIRLCDCIDEKGSIVKNHFFDHTQKLKEEVKIMYSGFSFHSSASILTKSSETAVESLKKHSF